jgi:hypothetical protein
MDRPGFLNFLKAVFKLKAREGLIDQTLERMASALEGPVRELEKVWPDSKQVNADESNRPKFRLTFWTSGLVNETDNVYHIGDRLFSQTANRVRK